MFDEETLEKVTMEMLQSLEYESINGYELQREDFSKVLLEYLFSIIFIATSISINYIKVFFMFPLPPYFYSFF